MANTNVTYDPANDSAAEGAKLVTFARETWAEAQQESSSFRVMGTTSKSMDGGNMKLFPITKKREFKAKNQGIQITPAGEQDYTRRALFVKPYHEATQLDLGDKIDVHVDQFADAKKELKKTEGRLIDTIALSALVSPAYESSDADSSTRSGQLTANISLTTRVRIPFYHEAANATTVGFDTDTIEDILYVFALKDVTEDLCATLTPKVKNVLRKDSAFKNAENIFAPMKRSVDDNRQGFNYKDINWISCSRSILPILSQDNAGLDASAAADTLLTNKKIPSLDLAAAAAISGISYSYTGTNKTSITAARGVHADLTATTLKEVTVKSADVCYIWGKGGLYFADRPEETFMRHTDLPLLSHAEQSYVRVAFGAMLIDDDYVVAVPLAGTIA